MLVLTLLWTLIGGTVSGVVHDPQGRGLEDVKVELRSGAILLSQSTDTHGTFYFCCVTEGPVTISFSHPLAAQTGRFELGLPKEGSLSVAIELEPDGSGWTLRQCPSGGSADTSHRAYPAADLGRLPSTLHAFSLAGRMEVSIATERLDGSGMHDGESSMFGSRGASWSQNRLLWNGFDLTSGNAERTMFVPDLAAAASMTYEADSLRLSPSGAVMAVTSAGGESNIHGQAHLFSQSGMLQSVNVTPRLRSFGITQSDERYRHFEQGNIQLSGPLSSKWFGFGSISRLETAKWVRNESIPVPRSMNTETLIVSGSLSGRDRAGVEWLGQQDHQPRSGANPQTGSEATRNMKRTFESFQAFWSSPASARRTIDTRAAVSLGKTDAGFQPGVALPSREERFPGFVDIPLVPSAEGGRGIVAVLNDVWTGSAPLAESTLDRRLQVRTDFETTAAGPGSSRHEFSAGVNAGTLRNRVRTHALDNLNLRFFRGTADSVRLISPGNVENNSGRIEVYGADRIRMRRLTLDLSALAGRLWGENAPAASASNRIHWLNIGAHAGAAYRFGRRYPTVLRAAMAQRYDDVLVRALNATHPNGSVTATHLWSDTNRDGMLQPGELGQLVKVEGSPLTRLDGALKQPFAREIHLEAAQTLPGNITLTLHGFRRVEHDLPALTNTGVPSSAYDPVAVLDPGDDGATQTGDEAIRTAFNQRPETLGHDDYILGSPPGIGAFSEGYEVRAGRDGTGFQWELAFTQYRAVATTPPGNGPSENDWAAFPVVNDPNAAINAYGSTFFDRGQGARFWGTWQGWRHTPFAWICAYLDGSPYGRILPVTGLNQGLVGILATRRGPGDGSPNAGKRTAYNLTTDVRVSHEFSVKPGRLYGTLDVFNLFNSAHAVREADVTSPNHLWRIPLSFQTPRSLQLGIHYAW